MRVKPASFELFVLRLCPPRIGMVRMCLARVWRSLVDRQQTVRLTEALLPVSA